MLGICNNHHSIFYLSPVLHVIRGGVQIRHLQRKLWGHCDCDSARSQIMALYIPFLWVSGVAPPMLQRGHYVCYTGGSAHVTRGQCPCYKRELKTCENMGFFLFISSSLNLQDSPLYPLHFGGFWLIWVF